MQNDSVHLAVNLGAPDTSLMADRELIELAAKAAGIDGAHECDKTCCFMLDDVSKGPLYWNPLTDDGDALRLAVKLRLDVNTGTEWSSVSWGRYPVAGHVSEKHEVDVCAATRRVIVRAAAGIAKTGISQTSPQAT